MSPRVELKMTPRLPVNDAPSDNGVHPTPDTKALIHLNHAGRRGARFAFFGQGRVSV